MHTIPPVLFSPQPRLKRAELPAAEPPLSLVRIWRMLEEEESEFTAVFRRLDEHDQANIVRAIQTFCKIQSVSLVSACELILALGRHLVFIEMSETDEEVRWIRKQLQL